MFFLLKEYFAIVHLKPVGDHIIKQSLTQKINKYGPSESSYGFPLKAASSVFFREASKSWAASVNNTNNSKNKE